MPLLVGNNFPRSRGGEGSLGHDQSGQEGSKGVCSSHLDCGMLSLVEYLSLEGWEVVDGTSLSFKSLSDIRDDEYHCQSK